MLASFDDGKFTREVCPVVVLKTSGWPPEIVEIGLHLLWKDPGNITRVIADGIRDADIVIIDSITICGLGYVDPQNLGSRVIVVSKYIPNIKKAINKVKEIYGNDEFEAIVNNYLSKVRCIEMGLSRLCIAPYGMNFHEALETVIKRVLVEPLPEDIRLAHLIASAIGRWLNKS